MVGVVVEGSGKEKVKTKGKREERTLNCGEEQTSNGWDFLGTFVYKSQNPFCVIELADSVQFNIAINVGSMIVRALKACFLLFKILL